MLGWAKLRAETLGPSTLYPRLAEFLIILLAALP